MTERYAAYLVSEAWLAKRKERLRMSKGRCSVPRCRKGKVIHCHHLTYERIFNEDLEDLLPLCGDHHGEAEELIASGKIDRRGDVAFLASETLRLIAPAKKPPKPKRKPVKKVKPGDRLRANPSFIRLLSIRNRNEFKSAVRKTFGKSNAIMGAACYLYDHCPARPGRYGPTDTYDLRRASGARRLRGLYG